MRHLDDDQLLRHSLQLSGDEEETQVEEHLSICSICRQKSEKIKSEIEILGSYEPPVQERLIRLPKSRQIPIVPLLKAAAILAIGFLFGFLTSEMSRPLHVNVVRQHLLPNAPAITVADYVTCEEDNIYMSF